ADFAGTSAILDLPEVAAAAGVRPRRVQPECLPLRRVTMHPDRFHARRAFLRDSFAGFGSLALASLMHDERLWAAPANPLAAKPPHMPAKAKSVIFLFMAGGPSQVDTFDPKPLLKKLHGQPKPASFGDAKYQTIQKDAKLLGTARTFAKHGKS